MNNYKIVYNDELYHHGILGQKWGTRNGPPYPLDAGDHSAAEKKAGYTKSIKGNSGSNKSSFRTRRLEKAVEANKRDVADLRKHGFHKEADAVAKVGEKNQQKLNKSRERDANGLTDEQKAKLKTAAKIGAAAAVTGLAAYGAYKYLQLGETEIHNNIIGVGQKSVNKLVSEKKAFVKQTMADIKSVGENSTYSMSNIPGHEVDNFTYSIGPRGSAEAQAKAGEIMTSANQKLQDYNAQISRTKDFFESYARDTSRKASVADKAKAANQVLKRKRLRYE